MPFRADAREATAPNDDEEAAAADSTIPAVNAFVFGEAEPTEEAENELGRSRTEANLGRRERC